MAKTAKTTKSKKVVVPMMRKDRAMKKGDVLGMKHPDVYDRHMQDIYIRSLLYVTRKVDSTVWKEAKKGVKARISLDTLTLREIEAVSLFMRGWVNL